MHLILLLAACTSETPGHSEPLSDDSEPSQQPVELAYDDGSSDNLSSPWSDDPGGVLAVHFTLPEGTTSLRSASFWIHGEHYDSPFNVRLYGWEGDRPGRLLEVDVPTTAGTASDAWFEVDLSELAIPLDQPEVMVGMEWLVAAGPEGQNAQWLGVDSTAPDSRSYWKTPSGGWHTHASVAGADADLMIRLTVE